MGFRKDTWATVWEIKPVSDTFCRGRISISRKNRQTGEYEVEFSGYVAFIGTACAAKAAKLKERDRVRIGDVDVTTQYVKESNTTYTNFKVFSFKTQEEYDVESGRTAPNGTPIPGQMTDDMSFVEEGLQGDEDTETPW